MAIKTPEVPEVPEVPVPKVLTPDVGLILSKQAERIDFLEARLKVREEKEGGILADILGLQAAIAPKPAPAPAPVLPKPEAVLTPFSLFGL